MVAHRLAARAGRMLVGTMMAFDKHLNLVLGEAVEVRRIHKDTVEKVGELRRFVCPCGLTWRVG